MIKDFVIQQYSDYYVAEIVTDRGDIVTDGETWDKLMHNVYEAIELHFSSQLQDKSSVRDFSVKLPQPILSFQFSLSNRHATHI